MADFVFGWREGLLGLIALLAIYMVFEVVRIRRLQRGESREPAPPPAPLPPSVPPPAESDSRSDLAAWNDPPAHLVQEALIQGVESDLAQVREELDALRGEVAALREELRHAIARIDASQTVSPLYSDAMQMAMNGYGTDIIAERCGISRAEAELVVSLVKNQAR